MYSKLRYASQILLLAIVLPAEAALAQTPAGVPSDAPTRVAQSDRISADSGTLPATAESARAVKTSARYVDDRSAMAEPAGSQTGALPAVSAWALLAVLASLVLMRVWRNGKRNLSAIR